MRFHHKGTKDTKKKKTKKIIENDGAEGGNPLRGDARSGFLPGLLALCPLCLCGELSSWRSCSINGSRASGGCSATSRRPTTCSTTCSASTSTATGAGGR